jgi:type IV secretory pathway TrbL component
MRKHAMIFAAISTLYWILIPAIAGPMLTFIEMNYGELSKSGFLSEATYAVALFVGYFSLCLWTFNRLQKQFEARSAGAA